MKKLFFIATFFIFSFAFPILSFAQDMMGFPSSSSDITAIQNQQQEEQEGKTFLNGLHNKTITCSQLKDADFEKIGEYFMGQSIGDTSRHIAMNEMMKSMMSKQGEEQMHIVAGKRMSGCEPNAPMPQGMTDVGMMQMMMGGWSSPSGLNQGNPEGVASRPYGAGNSMMNFGFTPFGVFSWIFMILWWVLIVAGIIALVKWLSGQSRSTTDHKKSPLEILKERYAKGEIDRKEFEEMKKDLS